MESNGETAEAAARADPGADSWLWGARGFRLLFWGLTSGFLLSAGIVSVPYFDAHDWPSVWLGLGFVAAGLVALGRVEVPGRSWKRRLRESAWMTLLLVGLAPHVLWWQSMPHDVYLISMVIVSTYAFVFLLFEICGLAGRLAVERGDLSFAMEARICRSVMPGLLVAGTGLLGVAFYLVWREHISLYAAFYILLSRLPRWSALIATIPLSLALGCAWKARRLCLDALSEAAGLPRRDLRQEAPAASAKDAAAGPDMSETVSKCCMETDKPL